MLIATHFPVDELILAFSQDESSPVLDASHPFAILIDLYQSNEILLTELRSVNVNHARAQAYLDQVGSNSQLGRAQILRLRTRRSAILTFLRANRLKARAILAPNSSTALSA